MTRFFARLVQRGPLLAVLDDLQGADRASLLLLELLVAVGAVSAGARAAIHGLTKVASRSYLLGMRAVGLKTLKNKLSEYIRLAARGETVLVTDRDRVVAEIVPPQVGRADTLSDARLAEAVRHGWLRPPLLHGVGAPPRAAVAKLADLLRELAADRDDR